MAELDQKSLESEQKPLESKQTPLEPEETPVVPARSSVPPKERKSILLPLLTVLLAVVGIGELALAGYIGLNTYRGVLAQRAYEAAQSEAGTAQGAGSFSFASPWRTIVNGETLWLLEDESPTANMPASGQTEDESDSDEEEYLSFRSPPPWIYGPFQSRRSQTSSSGSSSENTPAVSTGSPASGTAAVSPTPT